MGIVCSTRIGDKYNKSDELKGGKMMTNIESFAIFINGQSEAD